MYKILSKGSFVQCTNAARGSVVVAGSSKLWPRAMTLKVNSVKIDVNCQHQMLQQSAFNIFQVILSKSEFFSKRKENEFN